MAFEKLRLFLALVWWRICRFLVDFLYVKSLRPADQFQHKVVVIGDDFAAGVGDYVTMGSGAGIAQHLKPLVKQSDKVRHNWEIINAGVPGSRSADWKMNSPKQYFKKVFDASCTADASIVVVILGSIELRDPLANVFEIKRNLVEICDTMRKKGKRVCLATAVSPDPTAEQTANIASELNIALEEFCKSTTTEDLPVVLGPRLDNYAFRRDDALLYDKYHFNSSSYKLLARNTTDFLIPMMTAVEWSSWKEQLSKVEYDKALYD